MVAPLLPKERPLPKGGQPRISDRAALTSILLVLKTGTSWELLPAELGCGSGMTGWRRLRDWQRTGVWERPHRELLQRLAGLGEHRGQKGGEQTGPNPTDRGKPGTKRHVVVDRGGIPFAVRLSAANVHDSRLAEATFDAIPPISQPLVEIGRMATTMLLRMIEGDSLDATHVELSTSLIIRESCAPPTNLR